MTLPHQAETALLSEADFDQQFKAELLGLIPHLRGLSIVLCGRTVGEDIAQEALTKAWKARRSYQPGTQLKAWLFTILRNEYKSHQRRAWRQVAWDQDAVDMIPAPLGQQQWASELSDVGRALFRVPEEQREALMLVAAGGFSYTEAAAITNAPVGTLKSRVARARAKLVEILDGPEASPQRIPPSKSTTLVQFLKRIPQAHAETTDAVVAEKEIACTRR